MTELASSIEAPVWEPMSFSTDDDRASQEESDEDLCELFSENCRENVLETPAFPSLTIPIPQTPQEPGNDTSDAELGEFMGSFQDIDSQAEPISNSPRSAAEVLSTPSTESRSSISPRISERRTRKNTQENFDETSFSWPLDLDESVEPEISKSDDSAQSQNSNKRVRVSDEVSENKDEWLEFRAVSHLFTSPFDTSFGLLNRVEHGK